MGKPRSNTVGGYVRHKDAVYLKFEYDKPNGFVRWICSCGTVADYWVNIRVPHYAIKIVKDWYKLHVHICHPEMGDEDYGPIE